MRGDPGAKILRAVPDRGIDTAGCHRVDADALAGLFCGGDARHVGDTRLGHAIASDPRHRFDPGDRCGEDHAAAPPVAGLLLAHCAQDRSQRQERPVEIDGHAAPPFLEGMIRDLPAHADTGIEDRMVEPFEGGREIVPEPFFRDIADPVFDRAVEVEFVEAFRVTIDQHQARAAVIGEPARAGCADPGSCTGNESGTSAEGLSCHLPTLTR